MFTKSAAFYDAVYSFKDYAQEAERVRAVIEQHAQRPCAELLDVACGTGAHLAFLRSHYRVEGLDLDPELLAVAGERNPDVRLHQADMRDFDLGHTFDAVVCLFSAIGYVRTKEGLQQAIGCMARHTRPGGLVLVEPWFTPEVFRTGGVHSLVVDRPDLKIARMNISAVENGLSILDFHYLIGTPEGIEYFTERHELGLFTHEDYMAAFRASGLDTQHDEEGLTGRGLYLGHRPGSPEEEKRHPA